MQNLYKEWKLSEIPRQKKIKAFGAFICSGGSTMGMRLAGVQHLGGVEIDSRMAELYKVNHKPKYLFVEDIRTFNRRDDLPKELYELDILEGSPPCTTFSMAGKREQCWGVLKKFNEGFTKQTLDDLVYEYCDTIAKLRPKVAILENVPGLIAGAAKGYAIKVADRLQAAGYSVQIFLLNSATIGVPQSGMSVPPLMMKAITESILEMWFL